MSILTWISSAELLSPALHFLETGERFDANAARLAVGGVMELLQSAGVHAHDRVAVMMTRTPAAAFSALAVLAAGAALVPIPARPESGDANRKIARARVRALVAPKDLPGIEMPERCVFIDAAGAEMKSAIGCGSTPALRESDPEGEGLILFTSGTVGEPKGVVLSRRALAAAVANATRRLPFFGAGERFLSILSWAGGHGLIMTHLAPLAGGATLLVEREFDAFGAVRFYDALQKHRPTGVSVVPAMLKSIRDFHARAGGPGPGELRAISCASAMLPEDMRVWFRAWGAPVYNNYGLSETASWICIDDGFASAAPGSVGFPHVELRIAGEDGKDVLPGEIGRVLVRGEQVMTGYLDDPEATRAAFEGGFLDTGDLGRIAQDGRLVLAGRSKEVINVGGFKVLPQDVEAVALQCKNVIEAAAFSIPDDKTGEAVALTIVPADSSEFDDTDLRRTLKDRLPLHAVPKKILVLDEIPRNANGKVQRIRLLQFLAIFS